MPLINRCGGGGGSPLEVFNFPLSIQQHVPAPVTGKNIMHLATGHLSVNGADFYIGTDGYISVNGTLSTDTTIIVGSTLAVGSPSVSDPPMRYLEDGSDYIFSLVNTGMPIGGRCRVYIDSGTDTLLEYTPGIPAQPISGGKTITNYHIKFYAGAMGLGFELQLEKASVATSWERYTETVPLKNGHIWVIGNESDYNSVKICDSVTMDSNGLLYIKVPSMISGSETITQVKKVGSTKLTLSSIHTAPTGISLPWNVGSSNKNGNIVDINMQDPVIYSRIADIVDMNTAYRWDGSSWKMISQTGHYLFANMSSTGYPQFGYNQTAPNSFYAHSNFLPASFLWFEMTVSKDRQYVMFQGGSYVYVYRRIGDIFVRCDIHNYGSAVTEYLIKVTNTRSIFTIENYIINWTSGTTQAFSHEPQPDGSFQYVTPGLAINTGAYALRDYNRYPSEFDDTGEFLRVSSYYYMFGRDANKHLYIKASNIVNNPYIAQDNNHQGMSITDLNGKPVFIASCSNAVLGYMTITKTSDTSFTLAVTNGLINGGYWINKGFVRHTKSGKYLMLLHNQGGGNDGVFIYSLSSMANKTPNVGVSPTLEATLRVNTGSGETGCAVGARIFLSADEKFLYVVYSAVYNAQSYLRQFVLAVSDAGVVTSILSTQIASMPTGPYVTGMLATADYF